MKKLLRSIFSTILLLGVCTPVLSAQCDTTKINYELLCIPKHYHGKLRLTITNPYKNLKLDIDNCKIEGSNAIIINMPSGHYRLNGVIDDKIIFTDHIRLWRNKEVTVEIDTSLPVHNVFKVIGFVFCGIGLTTSIFTMPSYFRTKQVTEDNAFSIMMTTTGLIMFGRHYIGKIIEIKKYNKNIGYYRKLVKEKECGNRGGKVESHTEE